LVVAEVAEETVAAVVGLRLLVAGLVAAGLRLVATGWRRRRRTGGSLDSLESLDESVESVVSLEDSLESLDESLESVVVSESVDSLEDPLESDSR